MPRFISEKGCVLWGTFFHGTSMAVMGGAFNVRLWVFDVYWEETRDAMYCGPKVLKKSLPSHPLVLHTYANRAG